MPVQIYLQISNLFCSYIGILLLIDCNSRFLYFSFLKNKKKNSVINGLQKILRISGNFQEISSDGELAFLRPFLKKQNIYFYPKAKGHPRYFLLCICMKCMFYWFFFSFSFAENAQRTLKYHLYMALRLNKTKNWPAHLKGIWQTLVKFW